MSKRATRPARRFSKPGHWTDGPAPQPAPGTGTGPEDPTRYGDWERNGIAVDF